MKILEKAIIPDGTEIQIEDWKEDYSFIDILSIAAYPIAKNTSRCGWVQTGRKFRLEIEDFNNDEEVKQAFNDLVNGTKQITDFADQFHYEFHYENRDKYYMGLISSCNDF